jgi:hypothetical protein
MAARSEMLQADQVYATLSARQPPDGFEDQWIEPVFQARATHRGATGAHLALVHYGVRRAAFRAAHEWHGRNARRREGSVSDHVGAVAVLGSQNWIRLQPG